MNVSYTFFLLEGGRHRNQLRSPRGGYFILQLHDELIYEVAEEDIIQVNRMIHRFEYLPHANNSTFVFFVCSFTGCANCKARDGACC